MKIYLPKTEINKAYDGAWSKVIRETNPPDEVRAKFAGTDAISKASANHAAKEVLDYLMEAKDLKKLISRIAAMRLLLKEMDNE